MLKLSDKGIFIVNAEQILKDVQNLFLQVGGSNADLSPTSINGQMITAFTEWIISRDTELLTLFNNFNIDYASGIWLDSIGSLFGLIRIPGKPTEVKIKITGVTGLILPVNFTISNGTMDFYAPESYTINNSDNPDDYFLFLSKDIGITDIPANTVTQQIMPLEGIETITNPNPGISGTENESDKNFRLRIKNQQSLNSTAQIISLNSALSTITSDFLVLENFSNESQVINGATVGAHSIFVTAYGGNDLAIANAIYNKKSIGCGMTGTVAINLQTPLGLFIAKFNRPELIPIKIKMSIANSVSQPIDFILRAKNTIYNLFNEAAKIGVELYVSEFICAVSDAGVLDILAASLSLKSDNIDKLIIQFNALQRPTLDFGDIDIIVTTPTKR